MTNKNDVRDYFDNHKEERSSSGPKVSFYNLGDKVHGFTYWGQDKLEKVGKSSAKEKTAMWICPHCDSSFRCQVHKVKRGDVKSCGCIHGKSRSKDGKSENN